MERINQILSGKVLFFDVLGSPAFWRGCVNQGDCQVQRVNCGFNPCVGRVYAGNKKEPSLALAGCCGSFLGL